MITRRLIEAIEAGQVADWSLEPKFPRAPSMETFTISFKGEPFCLAVGKEGHNAFYYYTGAATWRTKEYEDIPEDDHHWKGCFWENFMVWLCDIEDWLIEQGAPAGILAKPRTLTEAWALALADERATSSVKEYAGKDPAHHRMIPWIQNIIHKQMKRLDELHFGSAPETE